MPNLTPFVKENGVSKKSSSNLLYKSSPSNDNQRRICELRHPRSRMSCWQFLRPDSRCWSTQSAHPQGKPKRRATPEIQFAEGFFLAVCRRLGRWVHRIKMGWNVMFRVECSFFQVLVFGTNDFHRERPASHPKKNSEH